MEKNKALFLDLDNTLVVTKSKETFPKDSSDWKFRKGMLKKVKEYYLNNYVIIIVTNQGGISEDYISPKEFSERVTDVMTQLGMYLKSTYHRGPFMNQDLTWLFTHKLFLKVADSDLNPELPRKPNPKIAISSFEEYNLDPGQCLMVGDASGLVRKTKILSVPITSTGKTKAYYKALKDKGMNDDNVTSSVEGNQKVYYHVKKDFSNSDREFANQAGMGYLDVEEFLL